MVDILVYQYGSVQNVLCTLCLNVEDIIICLIIAAVFDSSKRWDTLLCPTERFSAILLVVVMHTPRNFRLVDEK